MEQLSGLDNSFLWMEAGGQLGHIGSLSIFDASGLEGRSFFDALRETIEERLHLLPPYRRRLVEVPLGLDRPYWIEDPEFDMDFHLRHIAVPPPGDAEQLSALVSRIHARPLDRSKPLWEAYVIDGVGGSHVALYTKIHHATIDGVSGAQMSQVILDQSPEGDHVPPPDRKWKPDQVPGSFEMLTRGAVGAAVQPGRTVRSLARNARAIWGDSEALGFAARSVGLDQLPLVGDRFLPERSEYDAPAIPQDPAPRTPWNRSITSHRRFAFFSPSLASYTQIKNACGTTLNAVVMAVTGSALREYLQSKRALPLAPLVAMVPVSVRTDAQKGAGGNQVSNIIARLATDVDDPVDRLLRIHEEMKNAKRMQQALPANLMTDVTEIAMPAILAQAARISARTKIMDRMNPPFNVIISNVPGPRESLYCGGAEMVTYYPVSAIADGQGLNVTVTSYKDHLDYGLIACRELVPDVWKFKEFYAAALEELIKAAEQREGGA